ncbi:MAG: FAD-binding protein [Treponemataceae bacterium]
MEESTLVLGGRSMRFARCGTVVVGSGAAGFNAASRLHAFGERDLCLVTEHVNAGTSRNTGSDKQTYYKLSLSGEEGDSVGEMAASLFAGKAVDGDHALAEATLSAQCFFHLVELGVPFPHDRYGQFVGYKTDHDPRRRATSVGPYTSKMMTEALEADVAARGIEVCGGLQVIRVLAAEGRVLGLLCLDLARVENEVERYFAISCRNVVWATGGPAGIYADSVYPLGHYGATGLALEAGAAGKNLTEWQYGLASVKPRWNVSGSYMQVLPRVFSVSASLGDETEFLKPWFSSLGDELSAVFLKGYQWPFDSAKATGGSSLIDILVYIETRIKGRRVFLDYRTNPRDGEIDWSSLSSEARTYLERAGACRGRPIDRLLRLNAPAVDFYRDRGVDLAVEPLEIALSAQHNNGGLDVDAWWQTEVEGLFAVGEAAATHGVYRPGGAALNAGQVGSLRAARYISANRKGGGLDAQAFAEAAGPLVAEVAQAADVTRGGEEAASSARSPKELHASAAARMSRVGGAFRSSGAIAHALAETKAELAGLSSLVAVRKPSELADYYRLRDCLITQIAYLAAMADYVEQGGRSRGSALYQDSLGDLPHPLLDETFRFKKDSGALDGFVQEIRYSAGSARASWRPVRPLPKEDDFFENVWRSFREGGSFR